MPEVSPSQKESTESRMKRMKLLSYSIRNPFTMNGKRFCPLGEACKLFHMQNLGSAAEKADTVDRMTMSEIDKLLTQHQECLQNWIKSLHDTPREKSTGSA